MLTNLLFLMVISSGSVCCAAVFQKRYEEILPITCIGIVLILFLFGIIGYLKAGFYAVLVIASSMYVISCVYLAKRKQYRKFLYNLLTPGALIFMFTLIILSILNVGRVASGWDEFSHWMDIAKVMTTIDDFGTNPIAHSMFQSYPPGMSPLPVFFAKMLSVFSSK